MFRQDYTCPALLESFHISFAYGAVTRYGHTFRVFCYLNERHWPGPRSLATTNGISVDVFSSGY